MAVIEDVYLIGLSSHIFKRQRYSSSQVFESRKTCGSGGGSGSPGLEDSGSPGLEDAGSPGLEDFDLPGLGDSGLPVLADSVLPGLGDDG